MKKVTTLFINLFILSCFINGQSLISNVYNRNILSLNGKWNYIIDPYESGFYDYRYMAFDAENNADPNYGGFYIDRKPNDKSDRVEYSFDASPTLMVPGDWNSQDDKLLYYEGTIWYRRKFDYSKSTNLNRVFVYFAAANYETHVYLNGKKLGIHIGGFTPFNFEITNLLREKDNFLIVKVDNKRKREAVPTLNTDWWNYGGITRDVMLIEVPVTFVKHFAVQLKKGTKDVISGSIVLDGPPLETKCSIEIPELNILKNIDQLKNFEFQVKGIKYWSPENPKLYDVIIHYGESTVKDRIGFRTIETKGNQIIFNGNPIFLRGICIHEENPMRKGRAYSTEDAKLLLGWARELNCNFVRLAHYPHNENMIRMADEMGILVWEENPLYWTIMWENKETLENAKKQMSEIITRDINRASVIIWSMANETPVSTTRDTFLIEMAKLTRQMDNTRLISAAMEKQAKKGEPLTQVVEDPFAEYTDVVSFNEYVGWYDGLPEKCNMVKWEIHYNKPVIVSEFGGGALAGFHDDKLTRWSEEYQEDLYIQSIKMLRNIPQLSGMTPWLLVDFRSPKRMLPGIQDGYNRKGLYGTTGDKKKAFFILKSYYDEIEKNK